MKNGLRGVRMEADGGIDRAATTGNPRIAEASDGRNSINGAGVGTLEAEHVLVSTWWHFRRLGARREDERGGSSVRFSFQRAFEDERALYSELTSLAPDVTNDQAGKVDDGSKWTERVDSPR